MKKNLAVFLFLLCSNIASIKSFDGKQWWESWYAQKGISGPGSRGVLAQFKADVINSFIEEHSIKSAVEFGCGDGFNLQLINYKTYLGLDVSKTILKQCITMFKDDSTKSFMLYDPLVFKNNTLHDVDLVVCLDVLYHVIDEDEYKKVLDDIFSFSAPYVILYTSLENKGNSPLSPEIKHRDVMPYLQKYSDYEIKIVKQRYPHLTSADFIFLTKKF